MRPATLDLDVYVGEPRVYRLTFTGPDEVTPLVLSGEWAAQARHNPAAKAAVDIDVDASEMDEGVLTLTIPGAALPNRSARWVWDLEGETWGTVLAGPLLISPEVTRVGDTTGGSVTDLVIALGPDEVKVVSSAQIGPRGLPGDDGREVELSTSATHVRWRYAGDAEWTDLVALADLAGEDGDDGTEVELGTSATHIQWRYVGGVWTDLVALADLKGEDGFGVPDPAGQDADLVPVTDGAGAYGLGERGITQEAAETAIDARVPDPTGEPDGRWLKTEGGALVYTDAPAGGGATAAPKILLPTTGIPNVSSVIALPAAGRGYGMLLNLPVGGDYRYARFVVGTQSGTVRIAVNPVTAVLTSTTISVGAPAMDSGVVACPASGAVRLDLGATTLPPGTYLIMLECDNTTATFGGGASGSNLSALLSGFQSVSGVLLSPGNVNVSTQRWYALALGAA